MEAENLSNDVTFEKQMYGALLRHKRMEIGYRKVDQFAADLNAIGCTVSKAALYRIERGEQEPPSEFLLASNLILTGDTNSRELIDPCIPTCWSNPEDSDEVMRILKRNGLLNKVLGFEKKDDSKAAYYDSIMAELNSYDFEVFINSRSNEDHLYITVATGYNFEMEEFDDLEGFEISVPEDIERAVIGFLKRHAYQLDGSEVEKLVKHAERKILPVLEEYMETWRS